MATVRIDREIDIVTSNEVGTMARVFHLMADNGIYVRAFCCYGMGAQGVFLMVVSDATKAMDILDRHNLVCRASEVVLVESQDELGVGAKMAAALAEAGIAVEYAYASSAGPGPSLTVFQTKENTRAVDVLARAS
jgi:hypothetical protein